jgi:hypothetical protein
MLWCINDKKGGLQGNKKKKDELSEMMASKSSSSSSSKQHCLNPGSVGSSCVTR